MINYIEIRGTNRQLLGTIKDFTSLIWKTEYEGTGAFQIVVPYSQERFNWLKPDNYITRVDSEEIGFIEAVTMNFSKTDGRTITVSGRFGLVLLDRRIWVDILSSSYKCVLLKTSSTTSAIAVREIVNDTLVSPGWSRRQIAWLSLGAGNLPTETSNIHESTYQNVLELTSLILNEAMKSGNSSPLGHRIKFDRSALTATYEVYKGKTKNLVFSQKHKNLITFEYSYDKSLYKTGFLIAGDGEGSKRFYTYTDRRGSAEWYAKRREFCFESSLSKTYNDSGGAEHTYSNADYATNLVNDCKAHFSEYPQLEKVSGTVDLNAYTLGIDYDLGDVVIIRDDETTIETTARIWAITEIQDSAGYRVEANFEG